MFRCRCRLYAITSESVNEVEIWKANDGQVPLLRTMPANGTHSRLPSPKRRGLHFVGKAWKADRTQSATASACGGMTFGYTQ